MLARRDAMNIDHELSRLRAAYVARHPVSAERHREAAEVLPGGNTRSVLYYEPFPLVVARGDGARLWDADGHEYIDYLGEFTAGLYGHTHPRIRQAVLAALDGGINLAGHNLLEAQLARLLTQRFASLERVRFTNSGTEANLLALAAARRFTGRDKVMVFKGAYHGGVLSFPSGPAPVNAPFDVVLGRYNDLPDTAARVAADRTQLAAILVEPMQGAAGCIVGESGFLQGLRALADDAGALLVFDEVMSSRLTPGGLQQSLGIRPDLTTLGKYIGGGMSFGAFGGRADVMSLFDPRIAGHLPHAGTFNNNVLSMSAGIAGLTHIYTAQAAVALNDEGDALRERLNAVCRRRGLALQFTGLGSLMNLHGTCAAIARVDDIPDGEQRVKDLFFFHTLEQGVYVARRGFVALSLPLSAQDHGRFVQAFEDFADRYAALPELLPR
jgi:glutamate-1-semialdehyde 2,1-aminomutase